MPERKRSKRYPRITLEEAIDKVIELHSKFRTTPFSRDDFAEALGYTSGKSGSVTMQAAAIVHYGLMQSGSNGYTVSDLALRIINPLTPEEKHEAKVEAFMTAGIFREVYEDVKLDNKLPEALYVVLANKYGIARQVAKKVDGLFRKSAEYAGLVDLSGGIVGSTQKTLIPPEGQDDSLGVKKPNDDVIAEKHWKTSIPINNGVAIIDIQGDITSKDIEKIRKYLEIIELDINE